MRNAPSNTDDVIDSRDIIARIEELEAERDDSYTDCECGNEVAPDPNCPDCDGSTRKPLTAEEWATANPDAAAELAALTALAEEAEGYADDWKHGATLVRDTYFTEYAMEMLSDIGDLPRKLPGYIVIDEEATARNIQVDYTAVDFDGVTYWVR